MNKHLAHLVLSTVIASAMSSNVSAQSSQKTKPSPFEQGYGFNNDQFPAAYSAPARIDTKQGADIFFTGSFTYWYVDEDGFQLAANFIPSPHQLLFQSNTFSPGFKVGIGMNFDQDNWVGLIEYTWLRNRSRFHSASTEIDGQSLLSDDLDSPFTSIRRVNLDRVDATVSRPFYEGRSLTLLPYGGLSAGSLRQTFYSKATTVSGQDSHVNVSAWLVGPTTGLAMHWLLDYGFRLESELGVSLLFERYRSNARISSTLYTAGEQNRLAPVADMNLGIGWGTYLDRQRTHLDFLATYDFMNWWGQNLIRGFVDSGPAAYGEQPGDLQISGLTLTGRFDF